MKAFIQVSWFSFFFYKINELLVKVFLNIKWC